MKNMNDVIERLRNEGMKIADEIITNELNEYLVDYENALITCITNNSNKLFKTRVGKAKDILNVTRIKLVKYERLEKIYKDENIAEFNRFNIEFMEIMIKATFSIGDKHDTTELWEAVYKTLKEDKIKN